MGAPKKNEMSKSIVCLIYLYNSFPKRKAKIPVTKALTRATTIWLSEMNVISVIFGSFSYLH